MREYWIAAVPVVWHVVPNERDAIMGETFDPAKTTMQTIVYRQFTPGRIDHHNIQIAMTVVAMACLLARENRVRWAAAAGVAAGLGLAVGLEALAFQALIGAGYALELARDGIA